MTGRPSVSILVPTFNRASFLDRAIDSARRQSFRDLEIIVIDDASADDTGAVVLGHAVDTRVTYVRNDDNVGLVENWRRGFELAHGEFVCVLHDDDLFEADAVKALRSALIENPDAVLAFSDHWVIDADGARMDDIADDFSSRFARADLEPGPVADLPQRALIRRCVPIGSTMFRADAVRPEWFDANVGHALDISVTYACFRTGRPFIYVNQRLMNYRIHGGNVSLQRDVDMIGRDAFVYERVASDPACAGVAGEARAIAAASRRHRGMGFLGAHDPVRAHAEFVAASRLAPGAHSRIAVMMTSTAGRAGVYGGWRSAVDRSRAVWEVVRSRVGALRRFTRR